MKSIRGQSLVEMIVIIAVVVVLATGIVVATTVALSGAQNSSLRSGALQYAQEGIDITRGQRDAGWNTFALLGSTSDTPPQSNPTTYCVGSDGKFLNTLPCNINVGTVYTRSIGLNLVNPDDPIQAKMTVDVLVTWGDQTNDSNKVELKTDLTKWK